ncbi:hypothetical protein CSB95_4852 [Pseudomonas aeruginosa]|nr:hypothetical protein CSC32_2014 [Pseudomonas aeruginosa]GAA19004.1 hypothetical protein NCGM1179_3859 [Pseudomonas aeruginosa NCMG1179]AWE82603.1 hypothetical protein CSC29_0932 [Pseudomonas aeruginosa]AWF00255.1 hypothetical protein CSC26_5203 [Pseudomonas aeruginosa]PRW10729.1 hypothetical protein CSB95_4852 [Pseudomonas aeruginosa]
MCRADAFRRILAAYAASSRKSATLGHGPLWNGGRRRATGWRFTLSIRAGGVFALSDATAKLPDAPHMRARPAQVRGQE